MPPDGKTNGAGDRGNRRLRQLDRWLGVPLVLALSWLRSRRPLPKQMGAIGFLLLGAIGDSLLASTVIAALREEFPQSRLICFVNHSNRSIAEFVTHCDEIVVLPLKSPLRALGIIRSYRFDALLDFGQWPRISAVFAALAHARFTIGFRTPGQSRHFAFDAPVLHASDRHEIENFHALAGPLLGHPTGGWPHLPPLAGRSFLPDGRDWITFHPWPAGYKYKWRAWPEDRWVALARIVTGWGFGVAIVGGPSDRDASEALAKKIGSNAISFAGNTTLQETLQILANSKGIVAVNSGVMHLAAALDRPMVALHGPTSAKRWGPLSANAIALGPGPDKGCGYLNLGFEYPDNPPDCMGCITVEQAAQALRNLISVPVSV